MIISRSIHVAANGMISFLLWANSIPVCVCVCTYTNTAYHIFFIHSSVNGHLGCFYVLLLQIVLLLTLGCIYFFEIEFSLDICPEVGLLDYKVALFSVF